MNNERPDSRCNGLVDLEPTDSCGVGLVVSIDNQPRNKILDLGLTSLANVAHRGAVGADGKTGDGAGVSTSIPRTLLLKWLKELGVRNPPPLVGVGVFFLPSGAVRRATALDLVKDKIASVGLRVIGVRDVPVDRTQLGSAAAETCPDIVQVFVSTRAQDSDEFERELFLARRAIEHAPQDGNGLEIYVASFSGRMIVYKAMVLSALLRDFYLDLQDPDYDCVVCLYHQRFSTNTAPQWEMCQPFRMLAHNGEINTIRGNRNWMTARESMFEHPNWILHRARVRRLFSFDESDSSSLDNVLEILTLSGRSVIHAMAMLIPPAWQNDPRISVAERAFYDFHGCFSEPWDGPASVAMNDGRFAAACLDRNGLRPARYKITEDDILIVGSEVGTERIDDSSVVHKGRLGPGQMIAVDLVERRILFDDQIKQMLASQQPYAEWINENRTQFVSKPNDVSNSCISDNTEFLRHQIAAGLMREEVDVVLTKMAQNGLEPTFSMGVDTPLAVLSRHPRLLSDYFKQRFAQVTNPPIDPIREQLVMSLSVSLGPERNILAESSNQCRVFELPEPVLLPGELEQLDHPFKSEVIDCTWERASGAEGLRTAVRKIVGQAQLAVETHATVLVLSDRNVSVNRVAVPMLLIVGAVHHELCKSGHRMMCSLIAETSDVRDPHQLALLFGYGCSAVSPYLAFGTIERLFEKGTFEESQFLTCCENYRQALNKGVLKIMSKMGVSILNSYQGAQIFEAIGIGPDVIDTCFKYSYSNIGGVGFNEIASDCLLRHDRAFTTDCADLKLADLGISKPKRSGELHAIDGKVTKNIHRFVRENNPVDFEDFRKQLEGHAPVSIRDLLEIQLRKEGPISLDEVEPIESIRRRFTTAAMSLGAVSPEAHEAIAIAMNEIGGKSNSGEGGEDPARFSANSDGTSANSRIKQVASGRFGVDAEYLSSADEIEIKMAQGAKPGEGGQLPGFKVNELIAKLRNTEQGITLISPPPHHDIYSIEDLAQLIYDLKMVNPVARICVKLVAKTGVGGIAVGVAKAHADSILISGHSGGTGASPLTSIKHAGVPWELGVAETHQSLVASDLRDRVVLRADGGLRTGRDIIHAAILGAEEYNFGTMALIALGCVYVKKCHLNNCPVGIATQDPKYRAKFKGKPENLVNYLNAVANECREWLAKIGVRSIDELVGQTQFLKAVTDPLNSKTKNLKLDSLLYKPDAQKSAGRATSEKYDEIRPVVEAFDDPIVEEICNQKTDKIVFQQQIVNTDRNIGTRLAGVISSRHGRAGLPHDSILMELSGTAGQSLGAFLCSGISIDVVGEANDYTGKGMSGGEIVIRPPGDCRYKGNGNVIGGNTILYGATGGTLFAAGLVAERFCVRNSGAVAVVHGCGDHGCEYMTRGTAVILGDVGNNFGAGMTGGVAYVLDRNGSLSGLCNHQTVSLVDLAAIDSESLFKLLEEFVAKTGSPIARELLDNWEQAAKWFVKIVPKSARAQVSDPLGKGKRSTVS